MREHDESEGGKFSLYRHDWGLGRTGAKLNDAWKKVFDKGLDKAVDKASHEIDGLGVGAKKKMGFTKAKFKKEMKRCMKDDMDAGEREECAKEMEGGKFSLYRHDWGLGRTGKKLNDAWKKVFDKGLDKAVDKASHEIDGMGGRQQSKRKGRSAAQKAATAKLVAANRAKKAAPAPEPESEEEDIQPTKKRTASRKKATEVSMKKGDPLAWKTLKAPNKCGEEGRKAAQALAKCKANPVRRRLRAEAIDDWESEILSGRGMHAGAGLHAGYGLSAGAGLHAGIRGGSIGQRISPPTNIGSGGNLLGPRNPALAPQAGMQNFHMFTQLPVALQPPGMFSMNG